MRTMIPGSPGRTRALVAVSSALALGALVGGAVGAKSPEPSGGSSQTVVATTGALGTYLTDGAGMTLYYFAKDGPGTSVCNGKCAGFWPPLPAATAGDGATGAVGSITREDGSSQATYDGRPLYYFSKDTKAGDTNGQDVNEVWFVAASDGSLPAAPVYPIALGTGAASTFLTGEDGKTLYFFAKDTTPGVSTCTGVCLVEWPPFDNGGRDVFSAGDGVTGVIALATQSDGSEQVTYDGRPLYYFKGDAAAGDVTGQGLEEFFAATVDGAITKP